MGEKRSAMKNAIALILMLTTLTPSAFASELADIRWWVGKYPSQKVDGRDLFRFQPLNAALQKTLGPAKFRAFLKFRQDSVEFPVEKYGQSVIHIQLCERHNCGHNQIHLFVETARERVLVCQREVVMTRRSVTGSATWSAEGRRVVIADGECEAFDPSAKDGGWSKTRALIPAELRKVFEK